MANALVSTDAADVRDLYSLYGDGNIDAQAERDMIDAHDRIILQFPLYWYSCPPLLSTWLVEVWKRGWAYGPGGRALNFKTFGVAVTTGSHGRDYTTAGRYQRTLEEVMVPFELLARHAGMHYLNVFSLTAAREMSDLQLDQAVSAYCRHVREAIPAIVFDGRDDSRAQTVYPDHYYAGTKEQTNA